MAAPTKTTRRTAGKRANGKAPAAKKTADAPRRVFNMAEDMERDPDAPGVIIEGVKYDFAEEEDLAGAGLAEIRRIDKTIQDIEAKEGEGDTWEQAQAVMDGLAALTKIFLVDIPDSVVSRLTIRQHNWIREKHEQVTEAI